MLNLVARNPPREAARQPPRHRPAFQDLTDPHPGQNAPGPTPRQPSQQTHPRATPVSPGIRLREFFGALIILCFTIVCEVTQASEKFTRASENNHAGFTQASEKNHASVTHFFTHKFMHGITRIFSPSLSADIATVWRDMASAHQTSAARAFALSLSPRLEHKSWPPKLESKSAASRLQETINRARSPLAHLAETVGS